MDTFYSMVGSKLSVDDFEHHFPSKADLSLVESVQVKIDYWQSCFKNTLVVLNESLRLHQKRADDTTQSKENKITLLLA